MKTEDELDKLYECLNIVYGYFVGVIQLYWADDYIEL